MLNALRHHREEHRRSRSRSPTTPGAQRLAASPGGAPGRLADRHRHRGVLNALRHHREEHPWTSGLGRSRHLVLNALRHHREEHRTPRQTLRQTPRVLNALRHHREEHRAPWACAQERDLRVNALRHHREEHDGRSSLLVSNLKVLNALRHHREEHAGEKAGAFVFQVLCSTPCGITGRSTRGSAAAAVEGEVLNALRHHREEHKRHRPACGRCSRAQRLAASPGGALLNRDATAANIKCSTPCGITGRSTAMRSSP